MIQKFAIFLVYICGIFFIKCNHLIDEMDLIYNPQHFGKENAIYFSNKWIVETNKIENVHKIASSKGFQYGGLINDFDNYHIFEKFDHPEKHHEESPYHTNNLTEYNEISWAQQLFGRQLYKRDEFLVNEHGEERNLYEREFNDELWNLQWYEIGHKSNDSTTTVNMNLVPVYKIYNITGNGVRILIIDDGIEYTHEDIKDNFDKEISFNINRNNDDIMPRYEDPRNRHGTRCAGVVAMTANNGKCGVGVAYNAKIGGITLLDGVTDDIMEATAIKYANDRVDIYSGSWGPQDNGFSMDGPGHLALLALQYGASKGRNGRGSLYVFAAGNGGVFGDHCGADGYVNNIYSIAIASATQTGGIPYYAERCPAIIATTYSGSAENSVKIITTDLYNSCTLEHSGTSASAPLAAGVLGLVLEANNVLTWRDMQHIIIWSSEIAPLKRNVDWSSNALGLWYTPQFGFGLMNAYKMVTHAIGWENVPEKSICSVPFDLRNTKKSLTSKSSFFGTVFTDACGDSIRYLEHVQLNITLKYTTRGHLAIELISPLGTVSKLLEPRKYDFSAKGFNGWPFLTLQFWGESAVGTWTVVISDKVKIGKHRGEVEHVQLILHGTKKVPRHYIEKQREYEPFL